MGPEHDGYDIHAHLVDPTRGKRLASDITGGDLDDTWRPAIVTAISSQ